MRRVKILIGTVVALALLFLIANSKANDVVSNSETDMIARSKNPTVDKEALLRYRLQQKKLNTALVTYFKNAIASGDIVGAGVSIVHGDSILISTGFGKRSINKRARVDGETIFRLGSLSKGFAVVLAASLESECQLDWDDKVVDYLPGFQFGDSNNTRKIKLSHILSHSSGTPYHSFTNLVEAGLPVATIAKRFHEVTPQSEPGRQYSYQNAMFSLCQEIMQTVTGKNVKTLLRNRFFTPLGMNTVSMNHADLLEEDNIAMPHAHKEKEWTSLPLQDRYYNAVVAGGINASSSDMAKWMRFLLGHNPEVMKETAIADVFHPVIELKDNNKYYQRWPGHRRSSYGLGWRIHSLKDMDTREDFTIWHHGGSVNNYRNEIALYPESDLGICVLLNGNSGLAKTVIPDLHEIVKKNYGQVQK